MKLTTRLTLLGLFAAVLDGIDDAGRLWGRADAGGAALDPYPYLYGCNLNGNVQRGGSASPDPFVNASWNGSAVNMSQLQVYYVDRAAAVDVHSFSSSSTDDHVPFLGIQSLLSNDIPTNVTVMNSGQLVLDFGREHAGWLEFDVGVSDADTASGIWLSISEYSAPAVVNSGPKHPNKTALPVKYVDEGSDTATFRLELNEELYEGVRFGFLTVTQRPKKPFTITSIRLVAQIHPVEYGGGFASTSPLLDKVWWTAGYTVSLNLMPDYLGSILMMRGDRYSWTGDAHTSQAAAYALYSNAIVPFILHNINRTACATCSNGIESYALYWVLSLCDYYHSTGDVEAFVAFSSFAFAKLDHAIAIFPAISSTNLAFYGGDERTGDYFQHPNCAENQHAYRMLVLRALKEFGAAAAFAPSLKSKGQHYIQVAAQLFSSICTGDGKCWNGFGIHALADAINSDFFQKEEVAAMVAKGFSDPHQLVSFTPFNQYFITRALFEANATDLAIKSIEMNWGLQLAMGATTFWETFSDQWVHLNLTTPSKMMKPPFIPNGQNGYTSLCHPWSSGVAALLTRYILGIESIEPGFASWRVHPRALTRLGAVAGAHGVSGITVDLNMTSGIFKIFNDKPGRKGTLVVPRARSDGARLARIVGSDGIAHLPKSLESDVLIVNDLSCHPKCEFVAKWEDAYSDAAGRYYDGNHTNDEDYAAAFLGRDSATQGMKWQGRYGKDGYVLFSAGASNHDIEKLPLYVKSIQAFTGNSKTANKVRFPVDSYPRFCGLTPSGSLGGITTGNPSACAQTFAVDMEFNDSSWHRVTIYAVDAGSHTRIQTIEIFDLATMNIISPWQTMRNFTDGAFWTWSYNASMRIRIAYVRSDVDASGATLSGVFFDTSGTAREDAPVPDSEDSFYPEEKKEEAAPAK